MDEAAIHDRLTQAAGALTYRRLGELTGTHPETVRRYMQGQAPSAEFLAGVCRSLGVSGSWLLTGSGPMHEAEVRLEARASELVAQLIERVDALERTVRAMDERIGDGELLGPRRAARLDMRTHDAAGMG